MEDILKSGILGIGLIVISILSAPILNEDKDKEIGLGSEDVELKTERDIRIPL